MLQLLKEEYRILKSKYPSFVPRHRASRDPGMDLRLVSPNLEVLDLARSGQETAAAMISPHRDTTYSSNFHSPMGTSIQDTK